MMTATNYSIMRCTRAAWDAWAVTTDIDGTERPTTGQEQLDRGVEGGQPADRIDRMEVTVG